MKGAEPVSSIPAETDKMLSSVVTDTLTSDSSSLPPVVTDTLLSDNSSSPPPPRPERPPSFIKQRPSSLVGYRAVEPPPTVPTVPSPAPPTTPPPIPPLARSPSPPLVITHPTYLPLSQPPNEFIACIAAVTPTGTEPAADAKKKKKKKRKSADYFSACATVDQASTVSTTNEVKCEDNDDFFPVTSEIVSNSTQVPVVINKSISPTIELSSDAIKNTVSPMIEAPSVDVKKKVSSPNKARKRASSSRSSREISQCATLPDPVSNSLSNPVSATGESDTAVPPAVPPAAPIAAPPAVPPAAATAALTAAPPAAPTAAATAALIAAPTGVRKKATRPTKLVVNSELGLSRMSANVPVLGQPVVNLPVIGKPVEGDGMLQLQRSTRKPSSRKAVTPSDNTVSNNSAVSTSPDQRQEVIYNCSIINHLIINCYFSFYS